MSKPTITENPEYTKILFYLLDSTTNTQERIATLQNKKVNAVYQDFFKLKKKNFIKLKTRERSRGFSNSEYTINFIGIMDLIKQHCIDFEQDRREINTLKLYFKKLKENNISISLDELVHTFISTRINYLFQIMPLLVAKNQELSLNIAAMLISSEDNKKRLSNYIENYGIKPFNEAMNLAYQYWEEHYKII